MADSADKKVASGKLSLRIVTHNRQLLDELCDEVGLPGREGDLGILPGHTALISNLRPGALTYRVGSDRRRLAILGGFCEVSSDRVSVLVENAFLPDEVDVESSTEAKKKAESDLRGAIDPEELERLQDQLAAAEAQLKIAS